MAEAECDRVLCLWSFFVWGKKLEFVREIENDIEKSKSI